MYVANATLQDTAKRGATEKTSFKLADKLNVDRVRCFIHRGNAIPRNRIASLTRFG